MYLQEMLKPNSTHAYADNKQEIRQAIKSGG